MTFWNKFSKDTRSASVAQIAGAVAMASLLAVPVAVQAANPAPNLVVSVTQSGSPLAAGQTNTYQISLSNKGNAGTGGFTVYATVPAYTTVAQGQAPGASCTAGWPCQPGQRVFWNTGLYAGQNATFQFSAQLAGTPPADGSAIETVVNTNLTNVGSAAAKATVRSAEGVHVSIACPPGEIAVAGSLDCIVSYANSGASSVNATLVYTFPSWMSVTTRSGGGIIGSGAVTWSGLTIPSGGGGWQTVTLKAPGGTAAGSNSTHTATLTPTASGAIAAVASTEAFVGSANPLQVGVSASPDAAQAGQVVTYSIHVSNTAASGTGGFTVFATVPNGTSVVKGQAGNGGCTASWPCQPGNAIYWNTGLYAGQAATFQFAAQTMTSAGLAKGSVTSTTVTTAQGGSAVSAVVLAGGGPVLSVSAPEQVPAGATYTYVLTYSNDGGLSHDSQLSMALPVGTTLVSASSGATQSNGLVTWDPTELAPGQSSSQTLTVRASQSAGAVIVGNAEVIDTETLQSYSRASVDTVVASTNPLQIGVSATPDAVRAGQVITYAIHASNSAAAGTGGFTIVASVPNGTTVAQGQAGNGGCTGSWPCTPGNEIYWNTGLYAGQETTYQFSAQVNNAPAPSIGTLLSSTVTTMQGGSARSSVVVEGSQPVLSLTAPEQIPASGAYTYVLTYGNAGASTANIDLVMPVPDGTTLVSASGGAALDDGILTWKSIPVAAGNAGSEQVTVSAPAAAAGVVMGNAQIIDSHTLFSLSRASVETAVGSANALQIGVSATPDAVQAGQVVTYLVHVSNPTASGTGGFTVFASVPNGTTVTQAQAGGGGCTGSWPCSPGNSIYWNTGLYAGQETTHQFAAQVNSAPAPVKGTMISTVVTTSQGGSASAAVVESGGAPVLSLSAPEQIPASATFTYVLTYSNDGGLSHAAQLSMPIPAGTTYLSASGGAVVSNGVASWKATTLAPGQTGSQTLTVKGAAAAGKVVVATAQVIDPSTLQSYSRATTDTIIASTNPLQLGVSAAPDAVQAGQTTTFSIHVSNTSTNGTGGFTVFASVPNGTSVTQGQAGGGGCTGAWPCTPGEEIYWNTGLYAGQAATFQFSAQVASSPNPAKGSMISTSVSTSQGGSAGAAVVIEGASPALAITVPEQVPAGSNYTYTLTYGNAASSAATLDLIMPVPAGTTFLSATSGATVSGGIVEWKSVPLGAGDVGSQQLTVKAPTSAGTIVMGDAQLIDAGSTPYSYGRATADTMVASTDSLKITATPSESEVSPGQSLGFTVVAVNTGASGSGGFTIFATVPNGMTVAQTQAAGAGCTTGWPCQPGDELYWNTGLDAGGSVSVRFSGTVSASPALPAGSPLVSTVTTRQGGSAMGTAFVK